MSNIVDAVGINVIGVTEAGPRGPAGAQGPPGAQGDPGPPGADGTDGGSYRHVQTSSEAVWTVVHDLGYKPGGIYAEDSAHRQIIGEVEHVDTTTLTISFFVGGVPAATSGEAYIS